MQNKTSNFLEPKHTNSPKSKKKRLNYRTVLIIVIIVIFILGALTLIYYKPVKTAYTKGLSGRNNFIAAQDKLIAQDFGAAGDSLEAAVSDFQSAQNEFKKLKWLSFLPWLGTQIKAIDNILLAGISTGEAVSKINSLAVEIVEPLEKNDNISLNSLSEEETRGLLKNIYEAKPELEAAKATIDQAVVYVNKTPNKGLVKKIKEVVEPLKEQIPQLQGAIDQAISASQIIPSIAGYPEQKTYLFLLQNNTEMRPTGGFIGTYGILKVKDGDIVSFNTDNSYNLDQPAEAWLNIEPPYPLTRYNKVYKWFFRDSNWSPDFPTSAQKAEWFYHQERGSEANIDGIIAVTPTFIQSLLTLTGPIQVNGLTFNSDNLVETLQFQVEQGFLRQGIGEAERKEIIGVLSKRILEDILDLPKDKWPDLWQVFTKDISEKQILIYLKDAYTQNYIIKENWGGQIQNTEYDYFSIFDANLASLKTDPAVKRTIEYSLQQDGGNLIADLTIHYNNEGNITWKTTRYRTYTRVYVPRGSTLLKAEGAMVDCNIDEAVEITPQEDLSKTVLDAFLCVEPKEERTLHFKYVLPSELAEKIINNNHYSLLVQKQPGTADFPLTLNIDLKKKSESVSGFDNSEINTDNNVLIHSSLSKDRELIIDY
jgi:flagellar basal body-associated protein FliL